MYKYILLIGSLCNIFYPRKHDYVKTSLPVSKCKDKTYPANMLNIFSDQKCLAGIYTKQKMYKQIRQSWWCFSCFFIFITHLISIFFIFIFFYMKENYFCPSKFWFMYKLLIVFLLSALYVVTNVQAAHIIGGEVSYACISSNSVTKQTTFTVK